MDSPTEDNLTDKRSFEHSLAELEAIVHQLEDGQLGLAESLARYEHGVKHLKHCYQLLQQAERKIELLTGVADDGSALTQAFDDEAAPLEASAGKRRPRKARPAASPGDIDA
ncbi:MAG: exodeoxyribonuclease VII small subunit [Pirellulaceae bacterium]